MIVIPAIDLLEGKAVRLHQGRYDQVTVYDEKPVERAKAFRALCTRLHVVDLEGARAGHCVQAKCVRTLIEAFGPGVQVGGGVRSRESFESYRALGASRIVLGSAAVQDPTLVRELALEYPQTVIVAVDAKDGWVAKNGWTQVTEVSALDVARSFADLPLAGFLYTDIARDGTGVGPNVEMTVRLARETKIPVIASGGIGSREHVAELTKHGIESAIVGRAIYDGSLTLEQALLAAQEG